MNRQQFEEALAKGIRTFICDGLYYSGEDVITAGEIVELKKDDMTTAPQFYYPNKETRESDSNDNWNYIDLEYLTPVEEGAFPMNRQEFEKAIARGIKTFRCISRHEKQEGDIIEVGEIVELKFDDGSYDPAFYYPNKEQREFNNDDNWTYILLPKLKPFSPVTLNQYQDWADFIVSEVASFHDLAGHDEYVEYLRYTIQNIGEYIGGQAGEMAIELSDLIRDYDEDMCKREEALPEHDYKVGEILRVTADTLPLKALCLSK